MSINYPSNHSSNQRVDKREKSMTEFVVVIIVFAVLMKVFISYISEQEQNISSAGFNALAQNFNSTVLAVHAQWLMEGKPEIIWLASLNKQNKLAITINKQGWLDVSNQSSDSKNTTNCENIWQLAMAIPMQLMKLSIAAIELRGKTSNDYHYCRYLLPSGAHFEYSSETGKVTRVVQVSK